jgi:hypothetical protein
VTATVGVDTRVLTAPGWKRRVKTDCASAHRLISGPLRPLHAAVVGRARQAGAHSLILSGSTARGRRTEISDLDYHLIGSKIPTRDLSLELDIHVLSPEKMRAEILKGDDLIRWSIRLVSCCSMTARFSVRHVWSSRNDRGQTLTASLSMQRSLWTSLDALLTQAITTAL